MSNINLVNMIGSDPDANKLHYGVHKDRNASLHIKTGGKQFHFDLNNPHHVDWGKQKIKKEKKEKKNGDIYEQRKKKQYPINFI